MPLTCTCTCEYCRTIREGNAGDQETGWFSRNLSQENLFKILLFAIFVFLVTTSASPAVILAGVIHGFLRNERVIRVMMLYTMLWAWFVWSFTTTCLINWCPTCSKTCRIDAAKELASELLRSLFYDENRQRNHDLEAPPPVSPPSPARPPPPPPPPPPVPPAAAADQPCAICRENLQGNLRRWDTRRFERCGHGFHSRCLMRRLIQHDTCPMCMYDNDQQGGNP